MFLISRNKREINVYTLKNGGVSRNVLNIVIKVMWNWNTWTIYENTGNIYSKATPAFQIFCQYDGEKLIFIDSRIDSYHKNAEFFS